MTSEEAIKNLDDIPGLDPEYAHSSADEILLKFLKANGHEGVAEAWERCDERCDGFWYA